MTWGEVLGTPPTHIRGSLLRETRIPLRSMLSAHGIGPDRWVPLRICSPSYQAAHGAAGHERYREFLLVEDCGFGVAAISPDCNSDGRSAGLATTSSVRSMGRVSTWTVSSAIREAAVLAVLAPRAAREVLQDLEAAYLDE